MHFELWLTIGLESYCKCRTVTYTEEGTEKGIKVSLFSSEILDCDLFELLQCVCVI